MEKRPFDGIMVRLAGKGRGRIFMGGKWDEADFREDFRNLHYIRWNKFQHNFIMMYAASDMDWFSDADWEAVAHNLKIMARAAKIGRCHLTFDAEPYGFNPWNYTAQQHFEQKSFAEYNRMVRLRGRQFMQAIQDEYPDCIVHTFFTFSLFRSIFDEKDPEKAHQRLEAFSYSLFPAFLNGMLDVMAPTITLTDGNEPAYYYTNSESFFRAFHDMRHGALKLVDPANVTKFKTQCQASQALYVDHLFDYRTRRYISHYMTPEERARWFEHNTYYALKTSDEFVWLYSEKMDWWLDRNLPPGLEEAVISAREAIAAGRPLGFDLEEIMEQARVREGEYLEANLQRRTARIPRLPDGMAPVIDGSLDDPAWEHAARLEDFIPLFGAADDSLKAATEAWAAWDNENLYIAIRCTEPLPQKMQVLGTQRDDAVWNGDSVDIFVSLDQAAEPHFHFIINPANVIWDARWTGENDLSWNPQWHSATHVGDSAWVVEAALPWSALETAPAPGHTFRANLCRQRRAESELSAWSQVVGGFMEPNNMGTWILE